MAQKNNKKILAALISCGSIRKAATVAGVSETTIRTRLKDPDFREKYETAKSKILTEACNAVTARLTTAIDVLDSIMEDERNPATVRVSAADGILRHGLRYIEVANIVPRLEALEAAQDDNQ